MKYPFKFLESYSKEDKDIFFGREEEIETLYEMAAQSNSLLLYGASGTGKTSLIQCGLAGKFKSYDWLPLTVRRGKNINESLEKVLTDAGGEVKGTNFGKHRDVTGISKLIRNAYLNHFKPIYIIFDQFEELFILSNSRDEEKKFTALLKEILLCEQPVKLIFSIREEYLGYLYDIERAIPQLFKKKLRVEPMGINKLIDFLNGLNRTETDSEVKVKEDEISEIGEVIFAKLNGKQKLPYIQLPYLQVLLDKIYRKTRKGDNPDEVVVFTLEAVNSIGDIGDVLSDFLEDQVVSISRKNVNIQNSITEHTVWKTLAVFITPEGTKKPIEIKKSTTLLADIGVDLFNDFTKEFVNRRILRPLGSTDDGDSYELAHDSLAKCIAEKRSGEEKELAVIRKLITDRIALNVNEYEPLSEKALNRIEPYEGKLEEDEKRLVEKSKVTWVKRRRRKIAILILSFALLTGFVVVMMFLTNKAKIQENIALEQKRIADSTLAAKENVDFISLRNRAIIITDVKGYPEAILSEMKALAGKYGDSVNWKREIGAIETKLNK